MESQSNDQNQQVNKREAFLLSAAVGMLLPEMLGAAMAMAQSISVSTPPIHTTTDCVLGAELPVLEDKCVFSGGYKLWKCLMSQDELFIAHPLASHPLCIPRKSLT